MDFSVVDETESSELAVSVEEQKLYSRVDGDDEDALIEQLIRAVTGEAEDITHRVFAPRQFTLTAALPLNDGILPVFPVASIESVAVGGEAIDPSLYTYSVPSSQGRYARLAAFVPSDGFPEDGMMEIVVNAGGNVPPQVVMWIKTRVSTLYEQRESHAMFNTGLKFVELGRDYATALLDPFIIHGGF
jgi:uncharacterized phiE125 gp8 family phage protein